MNIKPIPPQPVRKELIPALDAIRRALANSNHGLAGRIAITLAQIELPHPQPARWQAN